MSLQTAIIDSQAMNEPYHQSDTPTSGYIRWPAPWLKECLKRIQQLSRLKQNWDSYGARAINEYSVYRTIHIVQQLARITDAAPTVNPTPSGNLSLNWSWENDQLELDIEILADGLYEIAYSNLNDESQDRQSVTDQFAHAIEHIPRA